MSNRANMGPHRSRMARPGTGTPRSWAVPLMALLMAVTLGASADEASYNASHVRGEWIWSGMVKFAAPVPVPALYVDGAPPHTQVDPGQVVGIWAAMLGRARFDGAGHVRNEDVVKAGELQPLPPFPIPFLPPFPEIYEGEYSVSDDGVVEIALAGRDPGSPEGQVDYELDFHCLLNRNPAEMKCVISRFLTSLVDPNGYHAPITGIITFQKRH